MLVYGLNTLWTNTRRSSKGEGQSQRRCSKSKPSVWSGVGEQELVGEDWACARGPQNRIAMASRSVLELNLELCSL